MRWIKQKFLAIINNHLIDYPTPINQSYFFGFGSLAGIMLVIQIITGIFLAMHYTPNTLYAFSSIEHIMRDVNYGWLLRYLHANGASFFFIVIYIHIFRGLYFGSYFQPRGALWCSGVLIFILMMGTAFLGYVLPWGQMSFWGATVITNLVSAIPFIGQHIVYLLWGGFSVDNPTLNRFFSLHFFLPFVIAGLSLIHLILLHDHGSNNPLGIKLKNKLSYVGFYPYFYVKDLFGFFCLILIYFIFTFFYPNSLGHPDNYIMANSLITPAHIVPEWYFLPFYAILRSIPHKLLGVICMFSSLLILFLLPFINTSKIRSTAFRPIFKQFFWLNFINFIFLGFIGQKVVEQPFIFLGQFGVVYYFFFFLILIPLLGLLESFFLRLKK